MTKISSRYVGSLRTEAVHVQSGNQIITDAPLDNHGRGEAFSPTDLVCAALGSCMMTIMGIVASREGISLEGMEYHTEKTMQGAPRKIGEIKIHFHLPNSSLDPEQKKKLERAALTCPVALSLDPAIKQTVSFDF